MIADAHIYMMQAAVVVSTACVKPASVGGGSQAAQLHRGLLLAVTNTGTFLSIKGSTVQQPARRRRSFFGVGLCGPITSIHQSGRWRVRASCTVGLRRAHVLAVSSSCCTSSVRHLIHFLHRSIPFHSIDFKGCRHSNTRLPLIGLRIHHSV